MLPMPVFMPEYKFFITPMEMGLRIAGQSEFAGVNAEPNYARADILAKHMERVFPGISQADATKWMGRRPSMPDSLPVIGRSTTSMRYSNNGLPKPMPSTKRLPRRA